MGPGWLSQTNLRVVRVGTIKCDHDIGEKDKVSQKYNTILLYHLSYPSIVVIPHQRLWLLSWGASGLATAAAGIAAAYSVVFVSVTTYCLPLLFCCTPSWCKCTTLMVMVMPLLLLFRLTLILSLPVLCCYHPSASSILPQAAVVKALLKLNCVPVFLSKSLTHQCYYSYCKGVLWPVCALNPSLPSSATLSVVVFILLFFLGGVLPEYSDALQEAVSCPVCGGLFCAL